MSDSATDFLSTLEAVIVERRASPSADSYTSQLFASGAQRIAQKVGEEAIEVALAAGQNNSSEVRAEAADLIYHLIVLLANQDVRLADVVTELESRHGG